MRTLLPTLSGSLAAGALAPVGRTAERFIPEGLLPDPEVVTTAARNAWALSFGGGVRRPRPAQSTTLHDERHRTLRRFGPAPTGDRAPVLLIPPLAVATSCYDLMPGQSLVEFLQSTGRTPYLVDYGEMTYRDRDLGFEEWFDDILPDAIRRVSEDAGGHDVDLVAWSLGGTLSLLTAAAHPELPIRSVTAIGTPIDYRKNPTVLPLRMLGLLTDGNSVSAVTHLLGGVPAPMVQIGFRVTALQREVTKPWFIARNLHRTDTLARMEAIERFMGSMPGYPARLYSQMHKRLIMRNELAQGVIRIGARTIELAQVKVPVLAIGGTDDVIAPIPSVEAVTEVLTGSPLVRFETAPGSHLGVLTGPAAAETTWREIDSFLLDLATDGPAPR